MNINIEAAKEFLLASLWEYMFIIAFVLFAILFAWTHFKGKAYAIMLQAKSLAKDAVLKSGAEQEQWVVDTIYKLLPKPLQMITPQEQFNYMMKIIVHRLYIKAKDYLDNGVMDDSINDSSIH